MDDKNKKPVVSARELKRKQQKRMELYSADQVLNGSNDKNAILLHGLLTNVYLTGLLKDRKYLGNLYMPGTSPQGEPVDGDPLARPQVTHAVGSADIQHVISNKDRIIRWPNDLDITAAPNVTAEQMREYSSRFLEHLSHGDPEVRMLTFGSGADDEENKDFNAHQKMKSQDVYSTIMLVTLTPEHLRELLFDQSKHTLRGDNFHKIRNFIGLTPAGPTPKFEKVPAVYIDEKGKSHTHDDDGSAYYTWKRGKEEPVKAFFKPEVVKCFNKLYEDQLEKNPRLRDARWSDIMHCTADKLKIVVGIDCRLNRPYPLFHPQVIGGNTHSMMENPITETINKFFQIIGKATPEKRAAALADFTLRYVPLSTRYMGVQNTDSNAFDDIFRTLVILSMPSSPYMREKPLDTLMPAFDFEEERKQSKIFAEQNDNRFEILHSSAYKAYLPEGLHRYGARTVSQFIKSCGKLRPEEVQYLTEMNAQELPKEPTASEIALLKKLCNYEHAFSIDQPQHTSLNEDDIQGFHKRLLNNIEHARGIVSAMRNEKGVGVTGA